MGALKVKVPGVGYITIPRGEKGDSGAIVGESKIWNGPRLPEGGYLWEDGSEVSRATYAALFEALTIPLTGTITSGTTTLNIGSSDKTGIEIGHPVSGPGVQAGTSVTAIGASTITLSKSVTSSSTGAEFRVCPHGVGDGMTTFNLPDKRVRTLIGKGASHALGATEGLSTESLRATTWSHLHDHPATLQKVGAGNWVKAAGSGTSLTGGISGGYTDHNHAMSFSHPTGAVTASGGGQRVTTGGHGSTDLTAQAQGANHGHNHSLGISDPTHEHDVNMRIGSANNVDEDESARHAYAVTNYIIKY